MLTLIRPRRTLLNFPNSFKKTFFKVTVCGVKHSFLHKSSEINYNAIVGAPPGGQAETPSGRGKTLNL